MPCRDLCYDTQVVLPDLAVLRIAVFEESGRLIGHRVLPVKGIRPGYRHISLRNESGQFLTLPTLYVHVEVGDYVPDIYRDFAKALENPIQYQSELEKRSQQLLVLTEETDEAGDKNGDSDNPTQPSTNPRAEPEGGAEASGVTKESPVKRTQKLPSFKYSLRAKPSLSTTTINIDKEPQV